MKKTPGAPVIKLISTLFFIFLILSPSVHSIHPVSQITIIVDINGNGDFKSITEAIANADTTDVILIKQGFYNEHTINVNKKIEIIGEDSSTTIINCTNNRGFTLSSTYVDISNLQIINSVEYAISILPESGRCTIFNCLLNPLDKSVGIDVRSSDNSISNCSLYGSNKNKQGIKIHGSNNYITNCDITDFSNGILLLLESNNNNISNCNLINNENAIDIRLNSDNNIISNCNIYSNLQGIKIWQNANNNNIYLNNFWKNDKDVIDEENNSWDNGIKGNYWDLYNGYDNNEDGIADIPYVLSELNKDRYPIMNKIVPNIITSPGNLKIITAKYDNTPTIIWNPSIYSYGINGYVVKIDNNPEINIGNKNSWTTTENLSNGVHIFYIKALGNDNKESDYSTFTFSIDISFIDTDGDGWSDEDEKLYGSNLDDANNYPLDTDNDRFPDTIDKDDDNDGYNDEMELSYLSNPENSNDFPTDTDFDYLPDEDSPDKKYNGDVDDDNDHLLDIFEINLGSKPKIKSDVIKIFIADKSFFLVDISQNGVFDLLFEPESETTSALGKQAKNYLIDNNVDGKWDFIYISSEGDLSKYEEQNTPFNALLILTSIIVVFSLIIICLYLVMKNGVKYRISKTGKNNINKYLNKENSLIPELAKKDTVEMITQTKSMLQHIQQDVESYMKKLSQIEYQVNVAQTNINEKSEYSNEKNYTSIIQKDTILNQKESPTDDIESTVDKFLFKLESKDKVK